MKNLLILLFVLCAGTAFAQDVIVKKDGSTVVCRVVQVTATEITYKKWSDLNGSNYVMDKSLASGINYENGKKETFSETHSQYLPNNQNDGVQKYNDRALLALDAQSINPKYKKLKNIAWIGGASFTIIGVACIIADGNKTSTAYFPIGLISLGCGIAWTTHYLVSAHKIEKRANMLQSTTIFSHDFPFPNGTSLSLGPDLLSHRTQGRNTIGLGLRYNF